MALDTDTGSYLAKLYDNFSVPKRSEKNRSSPSSLPGSAIIVLMVILMTIIISYFLYTNLETDSDIFDGPLERKDSILGLDMTRDKRAVYIKKQT